MTVYKMLKVLPVWLALSGVANAGGWYSGYDPVDARANQAVADISADERAEVMYEMQEGDFAEAQAIIQQDEALKNEIRREQAFHDAARDAPQSSYRYEYYESR